MFPRHASQHLRHVEGSPYQIQPRPRPPSRIPFQHNTQGTGGQNVHSRSRQQGVKHCCWILWTIGWSLPISLLFSGVWHRHNAEPARPSPRDKSGSKATHQLFPHLTPGQVIPDKADNHDVCPLWFSRMRAVAALTIVITTGPPTTKGVRLPTALDLTLILNAIDGNVSETEQKPQ